MNASAMQSRVADAIKQYHCGHRAQAEQAARKLLCTDPHNSEAMHFLGLICLHSGRFDEALRLMRESVLLSPDVARYHCNLAAALGQMGRHEDALASLRRAVELKPGLPEAQQNLAVALDRLGRFAEALPAVEEAIRLRPTYAEAHNHRGNVLRGLGRIDEAEASHRKAIDLRPDFPQAWNNLGATLSEAGDQAGMIASYRRAAELPPQSARAHSDLLYALHYSSAYAPAQHLKEALAWAQKHAPGAQANQVHGCGSMRSGARLRIGYLSPDFRAHTIAHLIEPILQSHDRRRFEVFCYSSVSAPDAVTQRLRSLADAWRDVSRLDDEAAAKMIRGDRIDILVELAGHMGASRLLVLARRPAPVQVQLGYAGTTGLPQVDYRVTDVHSDPIGAEAFYSERLVRLANCAWPYRPSDNSPAVGTVPALRNGYVTFGSLNKPIKISDSAAALWSQVLGAVSGSRLLVLGAAGNRGLLEKFTRHGIDPKRVALAAPRPRSEYLQLFNRIDIALDPFPYNGDTTTCDGFWMGAPLVTLAGDVFVSRRGVCYLTGVGLTELIAHSREQYVSNAACLAGDLPRLAEIRSVLRERMRRSPLTDGPAYTCHLEQAFGQMWAEWMSCQR